MMKVVQPLRVLAYHRIHAKLIANWMKTNAQLLNGYELTSESRPSPAAKSLAIPASEGLSAARFATISSISFNIAPSAATSWELLSKPLERIRLFEGFITMICDKYICYLRPHDSRTFNSSLSWAWRCSNCNSFERISNSSSRFLFECMSNTTIRILWCIFENLFVNSKYSYFNDVMLRQISSNSFNSFSSLAPTELLGSDLTKEYVIFYIRIYEFFFRILEIVMKWANSLFQILSFATQCLLDKNAACLQIFQLDLNFLLFALDFLSHTQSTGKNVT